MTVSAFNDDVHLGACEKENLTKLESSHCEHKKEGESKDPLEDCSCVCHIHNCVTLVILNIKKIHVSEEVGLKQSYPPALIKKPKKHHRRINRPPIS